MLLLATAWKLAKLKLATHAMRMLCSIVTSCICHVRFLLEQTCPKFRTHLSKVRCQLSKPRFVPICQRAPAVTTTDSCHLNKMQCYFTKVSWCFLDATTYDKVCDSYEAEILLNDRLMMPTCREHNT